MMARTQDKPTLSIIVPVFNTEKYVSECIDSIVKQDMSECELLVIDDGSTDNSLKICDLFAQKHKNIEVIHTKNRGVSSARNIGIAKASGDYIWFVDSDDILESKAIKIIRDNYEKKYDMLAFGINEFDKKNCQSRIYEPGEIDGETAISRVIADNDLRGYLFNKVFKLDIIKKNNIRFDENIKTCEDLLFCVEYLKHAKKISVLKDVLYNYRQRRGGAIHSGLNASQATALDAFLKIEEKCKPGSLKVKSRALFVKAFYKYRPIISKTERGTYSKKVKQFSQDYRLFSKKDKGLIWGYRALHPLMLALHLKQYKGRQLYD